MSSKFDKLFNLIMEDINNDDEQEYIGDILYEKGFDDAQPVDSILMELLDEAKADPQTVYNKVIEAIKQYDYVEQNDKGENIVTITCFADHLYTNFPSEIIKDPQFKEDYQLFSNWWNEEGYDGWCGYGDRDGVITNGEIIDTIYNLFNDFGDGSEERPKIWYDDDYLDGQSDDEDEEE